MPSLRILYAVIVCLLLSISTSYRVSAQSGMPFEEFAGKLLTYYDSAMVNDVQAQLPPNTTFRVWGWDVGDYSGDGNFDVAFTVRQSNTKGREVTVYLFIDMDGYLQRVADYPYTFVETPLEVGMVIKNNACYITGKRREFEWTVKGYRFTEGNLVQLDEFSSTRLDRYAKESYRNFLTLDHDIAYQHPSTGDVAFRSVYKLLPCYGRGRTVYRSLVSQSDVATVAYVQRGAFTWTGPEDASMSIRSVYDTAHLYLTIQVHDDEVVLSRCDTCASDVIDLWFDTSDPGDDNDRVLGKRGRRSFVRKTADDGLYRLAVQIGNFKDILPRVLVSTTDSLNGDSTGVAGMTSVLAKSALRSDGYVVRLRIPFDAIGLKAKEIGLRKNREIGCTVVLHDIDNEFRPEEETTVATSAIEEMNPSTLGVMLFISDEYSFGECTPVYSKGVFDFLRSLGL